MKPRDEIILEFIERFGNPDEQEVDLCNHYFVGEICDFFNLRLGEYLLKYLELKQAAEKLAEALDTCYASTDPEYLNVDEHAQIKQALADFRERWPKEQGD